MKRLNLKATLVCAAIAMTLKVLDRFATYFYSLKETWLQYDSLIYWSLLGTQVVVGIFILITMILLGFALFQNRNELPTLTPALKRQAQILELIMFIYYVCFLVSGAHGEVYDWLYTLIFVFFAIWLWQFAFVHREKVAAEKMGKIGRCFAWFVIVCVVVAVTGMIVTVLCELEADWVVPLGSKIFHGVWFVWYIILLGSYISYSDKALKQPTSDQLADPQ